MSLVLVCSRTSLHQRLSVVFSRAFATGSSQTGSSSVEKKPSATNCLFHFHFHSPSFPNLPRLLLSLEPPISSCPAGTVLSGLNYLKGQPPILAMPDEDYPTWLWDLTNPKKKRHEAEDAGSGSDAEKRRLRRENRQLLRDKNKFGAR
ncbi:mitochondrial ribosomal protein L37-domain-containing protein [Pisolithus marmoratus]|nr:mitochondrial ribosomal protein L37-domain-containing protein [Pisolithus marmoratus]